MYLNFNTIFLKKKKKVNLKLLQSFKCSSWNINNKQIFYYLIILYKKKKSKFSQQKTHTTLKGMFLELYLKAFY